MKTCLMTWSQAHGWSKPDPALRDAQLVLYFAGPAAIGPADTFSFAKDNFPAAQIVGCSTGGEIAGEDVLDDGVSAVAVKFDKTVIRVATARVDQPGGSLEAGRAVANQLLDDGLRAVFMLADGTQTNGSELIAGARQVLPEQITLTGGLAGDGANFKQTHVGCNGPHQSGIVAAIGFYGDSLKVGWGSFGGWERFGPERRITKSVANVLHELDGEPALDLYKRYLGDEAANLPGSALLFPLTIRPVSNEMSAVVRTVVGIDETAKTMTFAGDIPQENIAQLMRGHFDGLVDGANRAGEAAAVAAQGPSLAILVSCIGRKLLMGQRIVDEVEAAAEALGSNAVLTGFYSYGEIAPHDFTGKCELHNQTMTITCFSEV